MATLNDNTSAARDDPRLVAEARRLTDRPYLVFYEYVSSGLVTAYHPEFEVDGIRFGVGHGSDENEACADLKLEREAVVLGLLRAGYFVPDPAHDATVYFSNPENIDF